MALRRTRKWQVNTKQVSDPKQLPKSTGDASYKGAWRPQGQSLQVQFCTAPVQARQVRWK